MIRVLIQDEKGNEVSEGIDIQANLLAHPDDSRFNCLAFIDPYGDTIFNRLQLKLLSEDLHILEESCQNHQQREIIKQIETLIKQCQEEPHLYIKFSGD
jgi:hypothetical protein